MPEDVEYELTAWIDLPLDLTDGHRPLTNVHCAYDKEGMVPDGTETLSAELRAKPACSWLGDAHELRITKNYP
jgi:hypothetical protein